jgi:hypothetical protein
MDPDFISGESLRQHYQTLLNQMKNMDNAYEQLSRSLHITLANQFLTLSIDRVKVTVI